MDRITEAYYGTYGNEALQRKTQERIIWICSRVRGEQVLDVGCSQGITSILLARNGFNVRGVDINDEAIAYAKKCLVDECDEVRARIRFECANFYHYDLKPKTYDSVIMGEILEHLINPERFLDNAWDILNETGRIVVTVPFGILDDPDHVRTFYFLELYKALYARFAINEIKYFGSWIGFAGTRRATILTTEPPLDAELVEALENAFFKNEREIRDKIIELSKKNVDYQNDLDKLEKELQAMQLQLTHQENIAHELSSQNEILRASSSVYMEEVKSKDEIINEMTISNEASSKNLAILQEKIEVLNAEKNYVSASLSKNETLLQELRSIIAELKAREEVLRVENDENKKRVSIIEAANSELEKDIRRRIVVNKRLSAHIDTKVQALNILDAENSRLKNEIVETRGKLVTLERENNDLIKNLHQKTEEIEKLNVSFDEFRKAKECLTSKVQALNILDAENSRLKNEIVETRGKLVTLERENNDLIKNLHQKTEEIEKLNVSFDEFRKAKECLTSKVQELTASINVLETSGGKKDKEFSEAKSSIQKKNIALVAQVDNLQKSKKQALDAQLKLQRQYSLLNQKYEALAKSKLGRLTLSYWNLKTKIKNKFYRKSICDSIVAIIIPTYKENVWVDEAIKSAIAQRRIGFRSEILICVNGGDRAYFERLVKSYSKHSNIKVLFTEKKGANVARNLGLTNTNADYVFFLDDDDFLTEDYILELFKGMSFKGVLFAAGAVRDWDVKTTSLVGEDGYIVKSLKKLGKGHHYDFLKGASLLSSFCGKLYDSRLFKTCGTLREDLAHSEDVVFWVENINKLKGKFYVADPFGTEAYVRRLTDNSASRPAAEGLHKFYITDRLNLLSILEENKRRVSKRLYKSFIQGKIDAQISHMIRYFETQPYSLQQVALSEISQSKYTFAKKIKSKLMTYMKAASLEKEPCVAIIIPTYKENVWLDKAIQSAITQKVLGFNLEVLVCVNGGDYSYYNFLQNKYKENALVKILFTTGKGLNTARKLGLSNTKADYVTFLDDDDFLTQTFIFDLLKGFTSSDVLFSTGRLIDWDVKTETYLEEESYIVKTLKNLGAGLHSDIIKGASILSSLCAKLYRSELFKICGDLREDLTHSEDIVFWVENIGKLKGQFYVSDPDGESAYVRRLTIDSMSRPSPEKMYKFYITDRLQILKIFTTNFFNPINDKRHRLFILGKIKTQTNTILGYFKTLSEDLKEKARNEIFSSENIFLNKSLFAKKRAIAFCHNFSPAIDASAIVATKRLREINALEKEQFYWQVISQDMSKIRSLDMDFKNFYEDFTIAEKKELKESFGFLPSGQKNYANAALKTAQAMPEPDIIYSRSLFVGSHMVALEYKKQHPHVKWYAEFSDPLSYGVDNKPRQCSGSPTWNEVELNVYKNADKIIFTNANQLEFMLSYNSEKALNNSIRERAIIMNHPVISRQYCDILPYQYPIDEHKINVGFFGTFYITRKCEDMLNILENENVVLHIFTTTPKDVKDGIPKHLRDRVLVNSTISQFEFLNLASKMDYLILTDTEFPGEINPYLPSKYADYVVTGSKILARVQSGSPLSLMENDNLIKCDTFTKEIVDSLRKQTK